VDGVLAMNSVTVRDADFRRAAFGRFAPNGCLFERCDFRGQVFDERHEVVFASRRQSVFRACLFDGSDLRQVRPGQARFEACSFAQANLDGWVSACAEFIDCTFAGTIRGVTFHGKPWGHAAAQIDPARATNAFKGNDFSASELVGVLFVDSIDVRQQIWPSGDAYVAMDRIQQRLTHARTRVLTWPDQEQRHEGLRMLQEVAFVYIHQQGIAAQQRSDERWSATAPVQREVWQVLEHIL